MMAVESELTKTSHVQRSCTVGTGKGELVAAAELVALYHRAFADYGTRALWNIREVAEPTSEQVLAITRQLRTEGDMGARLLAEEIEKAARAHI